MSGALTRSRTAAVIAVFFFTVLGIALLSESAGADETMLGGVDFATYCQNHGYSGATLAGPASGPNAAYNWRCYSGPTQVGIDVDAACREQYSPAAAYGRPLDVNDAYSWRCWVQSTTVTVGQPGAYEPNDTRGKAFGPLANGKDYYAQIETDNDEDWYRFYTASRTQLTITVTFQGDPEACFGPEAYLYRRGSNNGIDEEIDTERHRTGRIVTSVGAGAYFLKVANHFITCGENPVSYYALRVDASPPLSASDPCIPARARLGVLKRRLSRARPGHRARLLRSVRRAKHLARKLC